MMNIYNLSQKVTVRKIFTIFCMSLFTIFFLLMINSSWDLIFKKDLYGHDESVNSVISANLTRDFFPTQVRVNSLVKEQTSWMEGPDWQHIPPLFAYIPLPFFEIDGAPTIELKRLSYGLIILLSGLVFIWTVFMFEKRILAIFSATIASIFWILTPFTKDLITGVRFGTSDIVLAFMVMCSFSGFLWYIDNPQEKRKNYNWEKLALLGFVVSLPILTKNLLGAIPAATYFSILLYDQKGFTKRFFAGLISFLLSVLVYFGALYISSPITFRQEFLVSLQHMQDLEGWARPWHFFLTNYIPNNYTGGFTTIYFFGILSGIFFLFVTRFEKKTKTILCISLVWFVWNLIAVSIVKSKAPNFIFQSYLLSLFFAVYIFFLFFLKNRIFDYIYTLIKMFYKRNLLLVRNTLFFITITFLVGATYFFGNTINKISETRNIQYSYQSEHEKYYEFGEISRENGVGKDNLFVLNASQNDCWFRYYILFLVGSEARTLDEMINYNVSVNELKGSYNKLYFVLDQNSEFSNIEVPYDIEIIGEYKVLVLNISDLSNNYLDFLKSFYTKMYFANISCSWLPVK